MRRVTNHIREIRQNLRRSVGPHYEANAIAARLGVSRESLRAWEAGEVVPSVVHAQDLARDLGVTVEQLGFRRVEDLS